MGTRLPSAFRAHRSSTVNFTATNATGNTQLNPSGVSAATEYRVFNSGAVTVFIEFGTTSGVTASASTSLPLPAGAVEFFRPPVNAGNDYWLAGITSSSTAVVYITPGEGN